MPIYIYRCEKCVCCFKWLTFFLEKDDYYGDGHFSDRVCLTGQFNATRRMRCGSIPIK
jgi:hypothetical protein